MPASRDLPHPDPDAAPLPPSAQTPRTRVAVGRGRELGALARRYAGVIAAFLAASGWGLAQAIQSTQAVKAWVEAVGLWPSFVLVLIGLFGLHVAHIRHVLREALDTLRSSMERQVEVLERQMEMDRNLFQDALERVMTGAHEEAVIVAGEVRELRARLDEVPRLKVAARG